MNEINLLSRVQHRNVVSWLGYCVSGVERLLVYEFVANGSLDKFLFDDRKRGELDWKKRYNVVVGVARALLYLHEDCPNPMIHRDMKPHNILLDHNLDPKISDFGISRLFSQDDTHLQTHPLHSREYNTAPDGYTHILKTRVSGTVGYIDPEYLATSWLTEKADIYGFGVVLLEMISGRENISFMKDFKFTLMAWARMLYAEGRSLEIRDSTLTSDEEATEQIAKCIKIGLLCTERDPKLRPTMRHVLMMLSYEPYILKEPTSYAPTTYIDGAFSSTTILANGTAPTTSTSTALF